MPIHGGILYFIPPWPIRLNKIDKKVVEHSV